MTISLESRGTHSQSLWLLTSLSSSLRGCRRYTRLECAIGISSAKTFWWILISFSKSPILDSQHQLKADPTTHRNQAFLKPDSVQLDKLRQRLSISSQMKATEGSWLMSSMLESFCSAWYSRECHLAEPSTRTNSTDMSSLTLLSTSGRCTERWECKLIELHLHAGKSSSLCFREILSFAHLCKKFWLISGLPVTRTKPK